MSTSTTTNDTIIYGFIALPACLAASPPKPDTTPSTYSFSPHYTPTSSLSISAPPTALATRISAYAKSKLSRQTYNHCMRVYCFGLAIVRDFFPHYGVERGSKLEETFFLTCMLHDIGTADEFLLRTRLSFEFWGGFHALRVLQDARLTSGSDEGEGEVADVGEETGKSGGVAPQAQAESVCEAILRHQDVQDKGKITLITRMIHLGTLCDNAGMFAEWVSRQTIENVSREFPREGWCGCFKKVVETEWREKPWTMCSRIEDFPELVQKNAEKGGLMAEFE